MDGPGTGGGSLGRVAPVPESSDEDVLTQTTGCLLKVPQMFKLRKARLHSRGLDVDSAQSSLHSKSKNGARTEHRARGEF